MFITNADKNNIAETLEATLGCFEEITKSFVNVEKTHERDLGLVHEEIRVAAEVYLSLVKSMANLKQSVADAEFEKRVAIVANEIETKKRFEELYEFLGVSRFEREDGSYELIGNDELELELIFDDLPCKHFCGLVDGYCIDCDTQVRPKIEWPDMRNEIDPQTCTIISPDTPYTDNFVTHSPPTKKSKKKRGSKKRG